MFFIVLLAAIIQPHLLLVIPVIAAASWLDRARLVRAQVLSLRAAAALVLVELAVNVLGDGVRDVVEQRLVRR